MFEQLEARLTDTFTKLRGRPRVTEADLEEAIRDVRIALLEADVSLKVVKQLVGTVRERAIGAQVVHSVTGAQQVVKIVHDALVEMLGTEAVPIARAEKPPTVIVLVGLQGTGKTTSAAKIANLLRKQGRKPVLITLDTHRPAAMEQLETLGKQLGIPVRRSLDMSGGDTVVVDTAGRLHIDDAMMKEAEEQAKRMLEARFTLDDFYKQLQQIKKMGPIGDLLKMIPGMGQLSAQLPSGPEAERELRKVEAIISSMTRAERADPTILNGSRRKRIAKGSGTTVGDVNQLVKQFEEMRKLMKQIGGIAKGGRLPYHGPLRR